MGTRAIGYLNPIQSCLNFKTLNRPFWLHCGKGNLWKVAPFVVAHLESLTMFNNNVCVQLKVRLKNRVRNIVRRIAFKRLA